MHCSQPPSLQGEALWLWLHSTALTEHGTKSGPHHLWGQESPEALHSLTLSSRTPGESVGRGRGLRHLYPLSGPRLLDSNTQSQTPRPSCKASLPTQDPDKLTHTETKTPRLRHRPKDPGCQDGNPDPNTRVPSTDLLPACWSQFWHFGLGVSRWTTLGHQGDESGNFGVGGIWPAH